MDVDHPDCPGSGRNPPGLTCVLRPDREAALIGRQDLQFDHVRGVGQQLCDLHQRAVLRAGLVYGQEDVSDVQRSAPVGGGGRCAVAVSLISLMSVRPHLSATLAALILSMMTTCLLLYMVVVRLIPRLAEGLFTISTSRGPDACCTASEGRRCRG